MARIDIPQHAADRARRFGGIARLYGDEALVRLGRATATVVGVGGVGSWAAEALARSGIGRLRLVDLDHVAESNINRQVHALEDTLGMAKVEAMARRLAGIDGQLQVDAVDEFLDEANAATLVAGSDFVVDAIDQVRAKVAMVLACRTLDIPLVMAGGAGGKRDPARIQVADLARTVQDPLLARVRSKLRRDHGYPRDPKRRFGIDAVYSSEPVASPPGACDAPGGVAGLSCAGYGSSVAVTASFGLQAAARVLEVIARG